MERDTFLSVVPALNDNYCYLLRARESNEAMVIDPSEPSAIVNALEEKNLRLRFILNTHHHHDHVGGNSELVRRFSAEVWCSEFDRERVPNASKVFRDGDEVELLGHRMRAISIPGHTQGQMAFYFSDLAALFVGDTLFAMGCGRLFEGTAQQMFDSLKRICEFPHSTQLYFGHEYTKRNGAFAKSVETNNRTIDLRISEADDWLKKGKIVPPPTLAQELKVNPFLRTANSEIRTNLHLENATDLEVFTRLRDMRNTF